MFQVPGYQDWYNITYDNDISVYTYKLEEDLACGDLRILV